MLNKIKHFELQDHEWFMCLPFLLLYIVIVVLGYSGPMTGDEGRYYLFTKNLLNGFYSPSPPNINLWSGPGYPIVLIPFVALGLPRICITLLNACFHYFSVVYLFKSLKNCISQNNSLVLTICWGLYFVAYQELDFIVSECLTMFLITIFMYYLIVSLKYKSNLNLVLCGLSFGYLSLTKIIFGYVLLSMLTLAVFNFTIKRDANYLKIVRIFSFALLLNLPYLTYTYVLTGKYFYWGNSGGMSLYWMSTPFIGEYGDWRLTDTRGHFIEYSGSAGDPRLVENHKKDIEYVTSLPVIEQDDAYKKLAFENIKGHPVKYLQNIMSNFGRLLFGVPFSYEYQRNTVLS